MSDDPHAPQLPSFLKLDGCVGTGDPCEENPFPPGSPPFQVWAEATRQADEEIYRIGAAYLAEVATVETLGPRLVRLLQAKLNVWAKRGVQVVWSDTMLRDYDHWLVSYAEGLLETVAEHFAKHRLPEHAATLWLVRLRDALGASVLHWKAEARRYRQRQRLAGKELPAPASPTAGHKTPGEQADRRALVTGFLQRCNHEPNLPKKIIRAHIWRAAGRRDQGRQFQRWQARDPKATQTDSEEFDSLLAKRPADFIALLRSKGLLS